MESPARKLASEKDRAYYTSLVGVGLLADILPDLPLPSYTPTPLERAVLGHTSASSETRALLSNASPDLCAQIRTALASVDSNSISLKDVPNTPRKVPYKASKESPPLLRTLYAAKTLYPQPKLDLKKIDASQFRVGGTPTTPISSPSQRAKSDTPQSTISDSVSRDDHVPSSVPAPSGQSLSTPSQTQHVARKKHGRQSKQKPPPLTILSPTSAPAIVSPPPLPSAHVDSPSITPLARPSKRQRTSSTSPLEHKVKKMAQSLPSLVVSINRTVLPRDIHKHSTCPMPAKFRRRKTLLKDKNEPVVEEESLIVRVSRAFLHSLPSQANLDHRVPEQQHPLDCDGRKEGVANDFMLSEGVADQIVPHSSSLEGERKPKDKKRRRHQDKESLYKTLIKPYSQYLELLVENSDSSQSDQLLPRGVMMQLLTETNRLRQEGVLHQVSTDTLVRLITLMDQHVLDTAELFMNAIPEASDVDPKLWREMAKESIGRSLDASLVILSIVTAPHMPSNVQLEESVEQIISHAKYHLENNIYPEFDPVYRVEAKESGVLPRQKRRYTTGTANKVTLAVYHKLVEVMESLVVLLESQSLTDTTILKLSSLGIFPFFVENVSLLQLSALKLVRAIFSRYEKHRDLILEDIFTSLARLPTTKRNLRSFRLANGECIQMLTALILQLVQCMLIVPGRSDRAGSNSPTLENGKDKKKVELDMAMISSYDLALSTGKNFLSAFLKKCCSGKEEDDFRKLFDNFVQDLLSTLSVPEWPASEILLTLLGMLLVHTFSNRNNEQQLRLTSLEHLGVIAARLRSHAILSMEEDHTEIIDILAEIMKKKLDRTTPSPSPTGSKMDAFSENARHLQKALFAYLAVRSGSDPSCLYARNFYLGQWLRDNMTEMEKGLRSSPPGSPSSRANNAFPDPLPLSVKDVNEDGMLPSLSPSAQLVHQAEQTREFLLSLVEPMPPQVAGPLASILDERRAMIVTRYLASGRALSNSFDMYLQQLLRVLNEPAVHVRTRAMKALSTIVAADPGILSRPELQRAVHSRFLDQSTLVREAAVDLVGRFILVRPQLTTQYYEMLSERILDTGVSVRKRVIKILKDVCLNQPDFPKINEVCYKMIRRITDEEGIKQLVTSVFHQLWFTMPSGENVRPQLSRRVMNITEVVSMSKENEWLEQLIRQLLKSDDQNSVKSVLSVCQLMVDCLVDSLLTLDEASDQPPGSQKLVSCITTLYLFSKIKPRFLLRHAKTLHPYLSTQCNNQSDVMVIHYTALILKSVVPLMEHPSTSFLVSLEEDLTKLIMKHGQMIVQSCVACLGVVVNQVTNNYKLVKDCFHKFFACLEKVKLLHSQDPTSRQLVSLRPSILRSVFTVGLFCKHFDMDVIPSPVQAQGQPISRRVYSQLVYFCNHEEEEIRLKSLVGLGFLCIHYPEMMLEKEARELYLSSLGSNASLRMKCQVMKNLQTHLMELETTLKEADATRSEHQEESDQDSLLDLGDQHSSVSSNIAQTFLQPVLEAFSHTETQVRLAALQVTLHTLVQGLVHPGQCIPYLIAMSTDSEPAIKIKADQQLSEYSHRFGGFLQTHLTLGLKKAFHFQQLLTPDAVRGVMDQSSSLLAHLYSLVRSTKTQRRAFLKAFLRHFEDYEKNPLGMLLFVADNLAYFPYSIMEEPLFILHHVDLTLSVSGASILQSFKEALGTGGSATQVNDDDDDDELSKLSQQSYNLQQLNECCRSCQGCVLLLVLKQHLKKCYGLTDKKCQEYSPTEHNKAWEKAVSRRQGVVYNPTSVVNEVTKELAGQQILRSKDDCLKQYVQFKQLMNLLDPYEGEEEEDDADVTAHRHFPSPSQSHSHSLTAQEHPSATEIPPQLPPNPLAVLPTNRNTPVPVAQSITRSRLSSASSNASATSHQSEHGVKTQPSGTDKQASRHRRAVIILSDDEDFVHSGNR